MDKKKYNQMGFDFGDSDASQDTPAAGFRIKAMKPAPKAENDENSQEAVEQKNEESEELQVAASAFVNIEENPSANAEVSIDEQIQQKPVENPNNDSEVVPNTPVTVDPETDQVTESDIQAPVQAATNASAFLQAIDENQPAAASDEEPSVNEPTRSFAPKGLVRPAQVYAVEESAETEKVKAVADRSQGFTPATKIQVEKAEEPTVESEKPIIEQPIVATIPEMNVPADEHLIEEVSEIAEEAILNDNIPEQPKKSTRGRKSLKTLDAEAGLVSIPEDSALFRRQYYSIGEVAGMFGVNQSLLRFWENEFDIIQPRKNRKGDRHFRPVDIKNLELIYDLLRRRKLTIEGAKEFLKKNRQARERFEMIQSLQQIKGFLLEIKASL